MARMLSEDEAGIKFGTLVALKRPMLKCSADVWLNITADKTAPLKLKFDRAGYNHWDGLYAYCFKLPSSEELWLEFEDGLITEQRVRLLHDIFAFE